MEFSEKVNLKPIDPDKLKIEKVLGSVDTYTVWLELDSRPDNIWTGIFNDRLVKDLKIGGAMIYSPYITVCTSPDEIKKKIEWVKNIIDYTNQQVEIYNKKVEEEHEETRRREVTSKEDIKKMRELLRQ